MNAPSGKCKHVINIVTVSLTRTVPCSDPSSPFSNLVRFLQLNYCT